MILPVLKRKHYDYITLGISCQEVSRNIFIFFFDIIFLLFNKDAPFESSDCRGTGWAEEETPAAEPAPRSPTAALWAGFRREEPLLCLTADARQIARTMWQEGGHLCP